MTLDRTVVDSLFAPFARPGAPGASVAVVWRGRHLLHQAFGLSDVAAGTPASVETSYRLASLSKSFTAAAVLVLADEQRLSLDAPVREILPELPAHASGVTLRHLLSHTSGLRDYEDFVPDTQRVQVTDADVLRLVGDHADALYFAPGSEWRYSNTGYALLALVVERVSGRAFADFLRERLFTPAGLAHAVAHIEGRDTVHRRAYGHSVRSDSIERTDQSATSAVLGDGGIYASVDEVVRWADVMVRGENAGGVVSAARRREAITPYTLADGTVTTYGFGWFIEQHLGRTRLRHHGETRGFTNAISVYPDDSLTIVVLTNRTGSAPWSIVDRLAELVLRAR
jgi:CubicO group peptidase (beta-lactamase class C family)